MDQAFDAGFEFDECAIFGDVGDSTLEAGTDRIFRNRAFPRIRFQLLHAKADALGVAVDTNDLHLDGVTDVDDFAGVVDALIADVGDVQQAVDTAKVNKCTIIGDVLDDAVNDLAFDQILDQARTLFGTGFFEDRAARNDDIATTTVHLQNLERLGEVHQRAYVAHRADINLRTGKERNRATQINSEATFDAAEDNAFDAVAGSEFDFELVPCGFAACAVARQHGFTVQVFNAVDIDFDFIADLQR